MENSTENRAFTISFTLLQAGTAWVKYLAMLQRLPNVGVRKSICWIVQSFKYNPIINVPTRSLNVNTCRSNIKISSYFNFWKLGYFSDMVLLKNIFDTRKIFDDKLTMFFPLNPASHSKFFSEVVKSVMDPGRILLNINPVPIKEISTKAFPV